MEPPINTESEYSALIIEPIESIPDEKINFKNDWLFESIEHGDDHLFYVVIKCHLTYFAVKVLEYWAMDSKHSYTFQLDNNLFNKITNDLESTEALQLLTRCYMVSLNMTLDKFRLATVKEKGVSFEQMPVVIDPTTVARVRVELFNFLEREGE